VNLIEWEQELPREIREDPLWSNRAYRLSLFAADIGWSDAMALLRDRRTRGIADQLLRALASVSANIAEGYSRSTGPDRARFYEYALGSARETRDWYYKTRHVLAPDTVSARLDLLTNVVKMLMATIPDERQRRRPRPPR
jgi:four helix bundle protein